MYNGKIFDKFGWAFVSEDQDYTLEDYQQNGKFCRSGLAYHAAPNTSKCTETIAVFHGEGKEKLPEPYKCVPKDPQQKCKLVFKLQTKEFIRPDEYQKDENGNLQRDENGKKIIKEKGGEKVPFEKGENENMSGPG